mmetsp:Transcript_28086/g.68097  ORF Transcript_28086/g.68097 Transcript_28086/m.68097 type:complete len:241 (-) Transcript_28086:832-1554(-)
MLLQAVERKLRVINIDLHRILHELLADRAHLLAECSRKHHDLLLVRCRLEDLLHILAHVELFQHLIALIENEVLDTLRVQIFVAAQLQHTAGRSDDDVGRLGLEDALVLGDGHATIEHFRLNVRQVSAEPLKLVGDLIGELASVAKDESTNSCFFRLQLVQARKDEDGRLAHTRLRLTQNVHAQDGLRDALVLHFGRVLEAAVDDGAQQLGLQKEVAEAGRVNASVRSPPVERKGGDILG